MALMGLKEITDAIGVLLYEVVARKIHLTQMGHELAKTARAISGEWEAFEQQVDGGTDRGKLSGCWKSRFLRWRWLLGKSGSVIQGRETSEFIREAIDSTGNATWSPAGGAG